MNEEEMKELQQFKTLFMKLMGDSGLAPATVFKKEALDKAARQFHQMEIQRSEWVEESDLSDYFREASWSAGKFIREEFAFTAWLKYGRYYLYNKTAIKEQAAALKRSIITSDHVALTTIQEKEVTSGSEISFV